MNQVTIVYLDHFISKHTDAESFMKDWMQYMTMIINDATHGDAPLKIKLNITFEREEPKIEQSPTPIPHPIDGPGWYRSKNGKRVRITDRSIVNENRWCGMIDGEQDEGMIANLWNKDGTDYEGYTPWMIIAKEDVLLSQE